MPFLAGRPRRRDAQAAREPQFFAFELAHAYADAICADDRLYGEICSLALRVGRHLTERGQPGAWTRIDIAKLADELPERGDERRLLLFRLGGLLEWMADERLIPLVRAIDYGVEIERIARLPDPPLAAEAS